MTSSRALADPPFVFAIPLKPKRMCADWGRAQEHLRRTIASARHAAGGHNVLLCVACHDAPDLGDAAGDDVVILPVPFPEPDSGLAGGRDKSRKRRFIGAWLRQTVADDVYVMFLDADDLVRKGFVDYVLRRGADSYIIDAGYIVDLASGLLLHRDIGFHHSCGSSLVYRFRPDELPASWEDLTCAYSQFGTSPEQRGHQDYDKVAIDLGHAATLVPFRAVAYTVNHTESLWAAQHAGDVRRVRDARDIVSARQARALLADEFGAPDLAGRMTGAAGVAWAATKTSASRWGRRCSNQIPRPRGRDAQVGPSGR
jgi:hypothetical protein